MTGVSADRIAQLRNAQKEYLILCRLYALRIEEIYKLQKENHELKNRIIELEK